MINPKNSLGCTEMDKNDSREIDLSVLSRLESAYHALSLAVQDPVVIPNPEFDPKKHERLPIDTSYVYFYVEKDAGVAIVKRRISVAGKDIKESLQQHQEMYGVFGEIERRLTIGDREEVNNLIGGLCNKINSYGNFVLEHQRILGEEAFLEFPHYMGGNIGYRRRTVPSARVVSNSSGVIQVDFSERTVDQSIRSAQSFNIDGSHDGLKFETRELIKSMASFKLGRGPLWKEIYTGHPDHTYNKEIDLTKMLLKEHLGFEA